MRYTFNKGTYQQTVIDDHWTELLVQLFKTNDEVELVVDPVKLLQHMLNAKMDRIERGSPEDMSILDELHDLIRGYRDRIND